MASAYLFYSKVYFLLSILADIFGGKNHQAPLKQNTDAYSEMKNSKECDMFSGKNQQTSYRYPFYNQKKRLSEGSYQVLKICSQYGTELRS